MIQNLIFFYFFFFRGVGSLSQPRLNIFTVGNMRVMICLSQGGLRSLSASSSKCKWMENFLGMENSWLIPRKKKHYKMLRKPKKKLTKYPLTNHALSLGLRFNETGCAKVIGQLCFFPMIINAWKLTIFSKMHRWFL